MADPKRAVVEPPLVPAWATPSGPVATMAEAAFLAGAALNSLDQLVGSQPPWAGAWRQRLSLKCAVVATRLAGRNEDEAALRDAWILRAPGDDPGPAGNILAAWRRLGRQNIAIEPEALRPIAELAGLRWNDDLVAAILRVKGLLRDQLPAPLAAAQVVAEIHAARPDAELLGWWLADRVLAQKMGWSQPVPGLVAQRQSAAFRTQTGRGRVLPGEADFEKAVCVAVAVAAAEACRLGREMARRADRLAAAVPKLRAKGAGEAIRLLLDEDAVSGSLRTERLTRWASRRLFERLVSFDAVRELSGRSTFRIYGL
ncbi:DUF1403 family protein [Rhizobium sp. BK251]|uniref:DUF1403 family protein n=1 Tax=Rhizobium sp. BK251 TaxID=2512125 RepID=UPI0032AF796D